MSINEDVSVNMEVTILKAAEELFLAKGFDLTSTTQIAKKAGCNQALIHYYFRTKENLFVKIFESKFIEFFSMVRPERIHGLELHDKLREIISAHITMISKYPSLPMLVINEITINPGRFRKIIDNVRIMITPPIMELTSDLNRAESSGSIRRVDPFHLLFNIVSLNVFMFIARPIYMQVMENSGISYSEFVEERKEQIFDFVWNSIKK